MNRIVIVDYGMGNLNSVKRTLDRIGAESIISDLKSDILNAGKLILPGVGHFHHAVENIKRLGLWEALNESVEGMKTPVLGICLGMQLMAKHSEEGDINGFGWFDAEVARFRIQDNLKYKVPHIGWNEISIQKEDSLFKKVDISTGFYFVHSYHLVCNNRSDVLNETVYEYPFVSAIHKDNIYGVQYHPEKSHESGEQLLRNFVEKK